MTSAAMSAMVRPRSINVGSRTTSATRIRRPVSASSDARELFTRFDIATLARRINFPGSYDGPPPQYGRWPFKHPPCTDYLIGVALCFVGVSIAPSPL
jgi:hypothetical protein